jgi:hypothetical protein
MVVVDRNKFQIYITPWRAADGSHVEADAVSPATHTVENAAMYNYPILECLIAFAIVFSIGYLVADSNGREETVAPKNEAART